MPPAAVGSAPVSLYEPVLPVGVEVSPPSVDTPALGGSEAAVFAGNTGHRVVLGTALGSAIVVRASGVVDFIEVSNGRAVVWPFTDGQEEGV